MTLAVALIIIASALFLSGFFSGSETGIYCVNRLRLRLGFEQGNTAARRLEKLIENEQSALTVTLIGTNLMNYITTAAFAFVLSEYLSLSDRETEVYTVAILTPVVFVFGEVLPKNLFQLDADRLMLRGSLLLASAARLFTLTGLVKVLNTLARVATRLVGPGAISLAAFEPKRRVAVLLREALVGDVIGDEQSELVDRVVRLSGTPVHRVMVPRNRVTAIAASADRNELLKTARRSKHTRVPVYERHPRRIVGLVKIDALLADESWEKVADEVRPIATIGPHDTVSNAINLLQQSGHSVAVVVDRGGQMLGIVTIKDLLGEVVGEMGAW
jgi:CBS domain containing-hemolysin-like protein